MPDTVLSFVFVLWLLNSADTSYVAIDSLDKWKKSIDPNRITAGLTLLEL